jgi:hypothetical protein
MDGMKRAIAREEQDRRKEDRFASTLVIAASIIAADRLARDDIGRTLPQNHGHCHWTASDWLGPS